MTARARRQEHKDELRRFILEEAREVLAREGHENFSMRGLAQRIRYSPGTLYLYFSDKQDLLDALVEESFAKLHDELLASGDAGDPVCALKAGLRAYASFGLKYPNHYRFAFLIPPPRRRKPHAAFDVLRHFVGECARQGCLREIDVEMAAQALWAAVHGVTSLLITRPHFPWVEKDKLITHVVDNAVDALLAPSARSSICQPAPLTHSKTK